MKKLSRLLKEQRTSGAQSLILFDDVLDLEKVLTSPEIEKLLTSCYGGTILSVAQVDDPEKLHDWCRDEQYKADTQGYAKVYPFKANFESLKQDACSNQFSGPLYAQLFSPQDTVYDVLTITCQWFDGVFRNDYYVVGAIVDVDDLEKIKGKLK